MIRRTVVRMAETKFFIQNLPTPTRAGGTPSFLNFFDNLVQGTTAITRIGSQIRPQRLSFRFHLLFNFVVGSFEDATIRIVVMSPRKGQDNDAIINANNASTVSTAIDPTLTVVHYDKNFALQSSNAAGGSPAERTIRFIKRWGGTIQYTVGNAVPRGLLVMFVSNIGPGPLVSDIQLSGHLRMSYKDA